MPQEPSSPDRRELRALARHVTEHLDRSDPVGIYQGDDRAPAGEYGCLTWPLLGQL